MMLHRTIFAPPRSAVRYFSLTRHPRVPESGSPFSNFGSRLADQSRGSYKVEEDAIIETLLAISPPEGRPIALSDFPYKEMADREWSGYLPEVPKETTPENINMYVQKLTSFRYHETVNDLLERSLLNIVDSLPEILTKTSYLGIVSHLHFMTADKKCYEVLDKMRGNTEIEQDIDFDNALMACSRRTTVYAPRLERLERLQNIGKIANNNTWYVIFRMFRRMEPKIELFDLMERYMISTKPIFYSAMHYASRVLTAEQLVRYLKRGEDVDMNNLSPYLLNRLVECYLREDRVDEAWEKVKKSNVNGGTFAEFNRYYAYKGELYNCIAFSHLFTKTFGVKTHQIMANELLKMLPNVQFFERWFDFVNVMAYVLKNNSKNRSFINKHTLNDLRSYAEKKGKPEFDPTEFDESALVFKNELFENLRWEGNIGITTTDQFEKTAQLLKSPKSL